jgi:hypothetical protein
LHPSRFSVRIPNEKLVFNDDLSMDLLWLDVEFALHVVDTATRFGAAVFLEGQDVEQVWSAFMECWDWCTLVILRRHAPKLAQYSLQTPGNTYMTQAGSSYRSVELNHTTVSV